MPTMAKLNPKRKNLPTTVTLMGGVAEDIVIVAKKKTIKARKRGSAIPCGFDNCQICTIGCPPKKWMASAEYEFFKTASLVPNTQAESITIKVHGWSMMILFTMK